ncbi:hypothetical protein HCG49_00570 [Arenibacter sp. 6A1]|uniref:hypothetical protein n=1 Tax=Arenibacter sp. 6A1 TaxID=2720391 RepID=UPI001445A013|nr:hypothetical protein [Arenibacter sp. 6A1]NKI25049.1 hypothetical protein [Arenibacter sp. 6A1]
MNFKLKKYIFSILAILLLAAISVPTILKIQHALYEHQNFVCKEKGSLHVHEIEFECDFDTLTITHYYFWPFQEFTSYSAVEKTTKIINFYQFLSKYQKLHFSRRGPPSFL